MRYRLFVLTVVGLCWAAPAAPLWGQLSPKQPWLVLDVGGHTAPVSRALFTRDGKELITVSKDKTIRFWDAGTGDMLRVLRTPIGPAREGELYAAALSPDGKTLAVAGSSFFHPQNKEGKRPSPIYLIDLAAEEVRAVLSGHEFRILSLAFSPDGKRLAAGGWDRTVRVWDVATAKEMKVLKGHAGPVTSLAFSPDGKRLLGADSSGAPEALLWSVDKGEVLTRLAGHHKSPLTQVAWGPNGNRLATGSDGENFVALWDGEGKHVKNLEYTDRAMTCQSVAFTPDGKSLVVSGFDASKSRASRLDLPGGKGLDYVEENYVEPGNAVRVPAGPAAVSPDGRLVAVYGDRNFRVHLYDAHKGDPLAVCGVPLRQPSVVAWVKDKNPDSRTVVWRARVLPKDYDATKPLPEDPFFDRAFDLEKLRIVPVPAQEDVQFERNRWALPGVRLKVGADGGGLRLVRAMKPTDVVLAPKNGGGIVWETVSLVGPNRAVLCSTEGLMTIHDVSEKGAGKLLGHLSGFNGALNSVAPSPDNGRYLLASGEDNVLHVWDPNRPHKEDPTLVHSGRLMSVFVAPPASPKTKLTADWVAWTPEGYYAASAGGERLMGWHLNNGPDKLATFHPASRFRDRFYRPDAIGRLLKEGSLEKALQAAAKAGDGPKAKESTVIDATQVLPPDVDVKTSPPQGGKVKITATARPVGKEPVTGLQLLIDERPWTGKPDAEGAKGSGYEATWTVALPAGKHDIRALAHTASSLGTSRGMTRELEPEPKVKPKPALYVLAVGINDYQKAPKLAAAVPDATELEKVIEKHSSPPFSKVEAKVILDRDATKAGILKGLDWLKERQTPADVAIVFYAGHGDRDKQGEFYLLPQDVDPKDLAKTGLSRAEIKKRMQGLPGKVLVVLDACHSGAIGLLFDDMSRELTDEDCGVVVICAASPRETAGEKKHGFLTQSVMEALSGKADVSKKDDCVYLHHLQGYVIDRVEELSNDKQHPTAVVPPWMRSFYLSHPPKK